MASERVEDITERLNDAGNMWFLEGADDDAIAAFEESNGVTLPPSFKEWLSFSDGGDLDFIQLHGVGVAERGPVIDVDDEDRPDDSWMVIGFWLDGTPLVCKKDGSERIVTYDHEAGEIDEDEDYPDFFAFLEDLCAQLEESDEDDEDGDDDDDDVEYDDDDIEYDDEDGEEEEEDDVDVDDDEDADAEDDEENAGTDK